MSGRPSLEPHLRGTTRSSREGRPSAAYTTAVSGKNRMRRLPPDGTWNRAASAILPLDAHMFPEDSRPGRPSGVAAPVGSGEVPPWLPAQVVEGREGCLAV